MANEIFDYFAGTASRKLEPLDESEMFEDLLPTEEEVQPVEELGKERELQDSNVNADEVPGDENDQPAAASDRDDSEESYAEQEEMADADAHWDDLASALGLDPVPVKSTRSSARTTAPSAQREDKPGAAQVQKKASKAKEVRSSSKNKERATEGTPELFDADLVEEESETKGQEVLTSMFQPGDRPQAESPVRASDNPPIEEDDDDPFAAFSGARKRREIEIEDESIAEIEAVEEEPTTLQVDEDFVEFEVHDLGGRRDENRETDRRRRRQPERRDRSGRRANRDDNIGERPAARSASSSDRKRDADKETESGADEKTPEPPRSRRPARPPRRDQVSRRDVDVDIDVDDDVDLDAEAGSADETGKKKPKIPTWDDAITGVIEKNIKRHKSGSQRGGGRRRRN